MQHYLLSNGRLRPAQLHTSVLWRGVACVAPAMALLAADQPALGGRVFVAILCGWLGLLGIQRRAPEAGSLLLGVMPILGVYRGVYLPYLSLVALVLACLAFWLIVEPSRFRELGSNRTLVFLTSCGFVYWWTTFVLTLEYSNNLRVVELCLVASLVVLTGQRRSYLFTSLLMIGISALCLGAGFLPHGERLGMARMDDGLNLGNPVLLGLPLSLLILLSIANRGSWLLLERRPILRLVIICAASALLFLSTSRGSWVVTMMGFGVLFLTGGARQRAYLTVGALLMAGAFVLVGQTERGAAVDKFIGKVTDDEASLNSATSGRARQWEAIPRVLADSPFIGFGPGSSTEITGRYTGKPLKWHSLYLQIAGELGLVGIVAVSAFLIHLGWLAFRYWMRTSEVIPMLALACYMTIGISVSGFDSISGVYLGLAALSTTRAQHRRMRFVTERAKVSSVTA